MKLNIHQIFEQISADIFVIKEQNQNSCTITRVRKFLPETTVIDSDTLYLIDSSYSFPPDFSFPAHMLFINQYPESVPSVFLSCSVLTTTDISIDSLLYTISDIIAEYQNWECQILQCILKNSSLKNILQICTKMLKNPIAIFDMQQNLLMTAGHVPDISTKGELWNYVLSHGRSPDESEINPSLNSLLNNGRKPFFFQSDNRFHKIKRLIVPLYRNESIFGTLALSDVSAEFTPGEYLNVVQIQTFIEQAIQHTTEFAFSSKHMPWYIEQLIRGKEINQEVLFFNLARNGFIKEKKYFVWTFQKDSADGPSIKNFIPNISYLLNLEMIYNYSDQIVAVDQNLEHYHNLTLYKKMTNFLNQCHMYFGQSMCFENITELHTAFMQSQIALSQRKKEPGISFLEILPEYLVKTLFTSNEADGLMFPSMKNFQNIKKEYRQDLLICLEQYISSGLNLSATASNLFIHRHTVIYRIKKIEDLLNITFSKLSQSELGLLWLSCQRLLFKSFD